MKLRLSLIVLFIFILLAGCAANAETENEESRAKDGAAIDTKVVTMEDKIFETEDLEFYTLMNKLKLVLQTGDGGNEDYLEEQLDYYENINVNLQSLIELYAMSLLAEEKNYFVPEEKMHEAVTAFNERVEADEEAVTFIEEFGREKYNRNIEEYIRQTKLRDRIAEELEEELKEENPDATASEISYLLEKKFEDLYMDHLSTLEMEIHLQ